MAESQATANPKPDHRAKYSKRNPLQRTTKLQMTKSRVAVISAKNHKHQRRKRQSVTAKREKSLTPKVLTAILPLPNLT